MSNRICIDKTVINYALLNYNKLKGSDTHKNWVDNIMRRNR